MDWFTKIHEWYHAKPQLWSDEMVQHAVAKQKITAAEADAIKNISGNGTK
ncbi:MAG: XkdX family protein [Oscillospiraceae bacterium]|nr:XkdX family protein [Oscillospiraceae bacterium]